MTKIVMGELRTILGWWNRFWFETGAPERTRLFRVVFGAMLFALYLIRTLDLELFFSESGVVPLSVAPDLIPMEYRKSLLFIFTSDLALWIVNAILLVSLATLTLGIASRLSAFVAFVMHVSILHRNMAPNYGVDMIATFFLFYLCFADFSSPEKRRAAGPKAWLGSMALRFLQLQTCIIYMYAGLDKVKGPQWWGGEALWGVVSNVQIARWDFSFLSSFPLGVVLATYFTLVWEIYFPVLVWFKAVRPYVLVFGVLLHIGIGVTVSIPFFGALMIISYIPFLEEDYAARLNRLLPSFLR